ncbi:MAG: cob(I)yrinic acid a,c-diamide adenosyltransferase [Eubacteriales bacterium]|nr:cob(I)yrinic acid a,c-diamide adenosyltransferase [Eubacteriales bacterium]
MEKGLVCIFCGEGKGKTTAAIGKGIQAASVGKTVMIIQFLKKRQSDGIGFIQRLEPEIKLFRFERSENSYANLSEEERKEECANIRNGLNFARKVITTQGCDVLILDEVLGLVSAGIIDAEEIRNLIAARSGAMDLILTGVYKCEELWEMADEVTVMQMMKSSNQ